MNVLKGVSVNKVGAKKYETVIGDISAVVWECVCGGRNTADCKKNKI